MEDKNTLQPQTAGGTSLAVIDDLITDAGRGVEQIGANDVRPPRLSCCQAGSAERKTDDPKQIAGLNELDLFNNLSSENYGRSVKFAVITSLGSHWIEYDPAQLGVVLDGNVPEGDPRTEWTEDADGNRVKPKATFYRDYLVWLTEHQEVVSWSVKSTQLKVGVKLNGLLKLPLKIDNRIIVNPPAWARTYQIETKMEKDAQFSWGGFNLSTVGITPPDVRVMISKLADDYSKKKIDIDRDIVDVEAVETAAEPGQQTDATDM